MLNSRFYLGSSYVPQLQLISLWICVILRSDALRKKDKHSSNSKRALKKTIMVYLIDLYSQKKVHQKRIQSKMIYIYERRHARSPPLWWFYLLPIYIESMWFTLGHQNLTIFQLIHLLCKDNSRCKDNIDGRIFPHPKIMYKIIFSDTKIMYMIISLNVRLQKRRETILCRGYIR